MPLNEVKTSHTCPAVPVDNVCFLCGHLNPSAADRCEMCRGVVLPTKDRPEKGKPIDVLWHVFSISEDDSLISKQLVLHYAKNAMILSNDRVALRSKSADKNQAIVLRQQTDGTLHMSTYDISQTPITSATSRLATTTLNPSRTAAERSLRAVAGFYG